MKNRVITISREFGSGVLGINKCTEIICQLFLKFLFEICQ